MPKQAQTTTQDSTFSPFKSLQVILLNILRRQLFNSGTTSGYGSGPLVSDIAVSGGGDLGLMGGGIAPGEILAGLPSTAGDAMMAGATEGATEGAAAGAGEAAGSAGASAGLGTAAMLAAPIIVSWLTNMRGSGTNEPVMRRYGTINDVQAFTNALKNYNPQDVSSSPDLSRLYQNMIGVSRQGNVGADQNSGFTREQINNMLKQSNPGITDQQLLQLGNPSGYDAVTQAYKTFLGRDPGSSEYQLRLSTLPGYGTDSPWITGMYKQLQDISGSSEAQAYAKQKTDGTPNLDSFIQGLIKTNPQAKSLFGSTVNAVFNSNPFDINQQNMAGQSLG